MGRKEASRFEMDAGTRDRAYFVHGGPRGLVFGPKTSGRDDHVTVGFDDGEFSQVHRKVNGYEEWRVTPEGFQAEVDSLVANNVRPVEFASLRKEGTCIISLNRVKALFAVPQALSALVIPLVLRLVATKRVLRTASGQEIKLSIDRKKVEYVIGRLNGPLSVLGKLLKHVPPKAPLQVWRLVAKWILVRPSTPMGFEGDIFVVTSKVDVGLLWAGESGALRYLPIAPLLDLYLRAERSLPFGKLNELGNSWIGDITFVGRSW